MNLLNIKNLNKINLFKGNTSLKEWNVKQLEGFLIQDGFYFNEYGKVDTKNIIKEFIKKNKKKGQFLYDLLRKGDLSLNYTGHITCASWLGYTLDKILFISLSYRKEIDMIKIKTTDGQSMIVTQGLELLTNAGYKKSKDIKVGDELIGLIGNSYNGFKNGSIKNKDYVEILQILKDIKLNIIETNSNKILISKLNKKYFLYLNIIGINTNNKYIYIKDIEMLIKSITKKDIDDNDEGLDEILGGINKKKFFIRKIEYIQTIKILDGYISNIMTKLSMNYIINNIIIKK